MLFHPRSDPRVKQLGDWLIDAFKAEKGWSELGAELRPGTDAVAATLWVQYAHERFDHVGEFTPGSLEETLIKELAAEQGWQQAVLRVHVNWKKGSSKITLQAL